MSYLLLWGEAPQYQYEENYETLKDALEFINKAFTGDVLWNLNDGGHWFKLYEEVELELTQIFKETK